MCHYDEFFWIEVAFFMLFTATPILHVKASSKWAFHIGKRKDIILTDYSTISFVISLAMERNSFTAGDVFFAERMAIPMVRYLLW